MKKTTPLELTDEMIARNDEIDNAVYKCICTLTQKDSECDPNAENSDNILDWDMELIGEVDEAIVAVLKSHGLEVHSPCIVHNSDGTEEYGEFYKE